MNSKSLAYTLLAVLLWSTVASAFKITLKHTEPLIMVFYASLTSFFIFLFNYIFSRTSDYTLPGIKGILISAFSGFINPLLYYFCLFKAYSMLPAQIVQPLNYTWPLVFTLFAAIFFKEKLSFKTIVAMIIAFSGVIIISFRGNFSLTAGLNIMGIGLALLSSVIWAGYWTINLSDNRPDQLKLLLNFFFGTLFTFIVLKIKSVPININSASLAGSVYAGFFEMGITFLFWLKAVKLSENKPVTAILFYLTPFLSLILINIILHETIHYSTFTGLLLIVTGIIANSVNFKTFLFKKE